MISQYGVEPTMFWCFLIACFLICLCRVLLFLVFYCPVCFECINELFLCVFVSCCWLWLQVLCFVSSLRCLLCSCFFLEICFFFILRGGSGCIRSRCSGWCDRFVFSFS